MVHIRELVESQLAIALGWTEHVLTSIPSRWQMADLLQSLVAGMSGVTLVKPASERDLLQGRMDHAFEHSVFEGLVEVANLPQLVANPAFVHAALIAGKLIRAEVTVDERFICRLGGKHSTIDCEVNPFQAL